MIQLEAASAFIFYQPDRNFTGTDTKICKDGAHSIKRMVALIMGKVCPSSVSSGFTDPPISTILRETSNQELLDRYL